MDRIVPDNLKITDAHTHFFSHTWLEHFYLLAKEKFSGVNEVATFLGWECPPSNPSVLGEKWIAEQDKHRVARQVIFASKINDAEFLAAATNAFPNRLLGYFMLDPTTTDARNQAHYSINILGMKGILLFPALHHFHASDDSALVIYEEAMANTVPVFIHFGELNIPIFKKLGLPDPVDLTYSNPADLRGPASDFPDVNFIIPHFGCGRFEEAINLAKSCPNVYFDTSSSNSWIKSPLTLRDVFKQSLKNIGAERLLFGTDSSFFPRGWRADIFQEQFTILKSLGVSQSDLDLIFGGNIARILDLTD